jgi:Ras-related protein Rab-21
MKLVLLGEGRVGKTSLVLRYVNNVFSDKQQSTIQASFLSKRLTIGDTTATLSIWDTAGQERFHALGPIYYRDADGALLVYDITDAESFTKVKNWIKELRKMVGNDIKLCIAGNKSDLEKQRQVTVADAEQYAQSVGAQHFSTSAKTSKGIDECFLSLAKRVLEKRQASKKGVVSGGGAQRGGVVIEADDEKPAKSGCC